MNIRCVFRILSLLRLFETFFRSDKIQGGEKSHLKVERFNVFSVASNSFWTTLYLASECAVKNTGVFTFPRSPCMCLCLSLCFLRTLYSSCSWSSGSFCSHSHVTTVFRSVVRRHLHAYSSDGCGPGSYLDDLPIVMEPECSPLKTKALRWTVV